MSALEVVEELKRLRRGRGIAAPQLGDHVGPALRVVCDIYEDEDSESIRGKVSERLQALVTSLADDLRMAVLAAFGLHEQARSLFYKDRVRWLAEKLDRDDRTIRRRIDQGIQQVAALAIATGRSTDLPHPSRSWHTEDLRVTLALDQPVPEAFEFRRVVADADDIDELDLALTLTTPDARVPVDEADLQVDVFHGGSLTRRMMESSDRVGLALRLPSPLRRGERHEVALRFRAALRYPHYVCVPRHPVDHFELHVRFARPTPAEIVLLDNVFQDDARNHAVRGPSLSPDGSGEVHVDFRKLAPGFAYGVRWQD
ncbi:hypothetical protein [Amycolatopsis sp. CA-230715]|uniref:hypothetical protein n=1 Tax=Amycolatopsis sp. CA-230715 TaxID=2745196 RepID=UPI0020B2AFBF|nr:hypothetical protein [Amycolatopsis sp. CA-230715]